MARANEMRTPVTTGAFHKREGLDVEEQLETLVEVLKGQLVGQTGEVNERALENLVGSLTGLLTPESREKLFGFWVEMADKLGDEELTKRLLGLMSRLTGK